MPSGLRSVGTTAARARRWSLMVNDFLGGCGFIFDNPNATTLTYSLDCMWQLAPASRPRQPPAATHLTQAARTYRQTLASSSATSHPVYTCVRTSSRQILWRRGYVYMRFCHNPHASGAAGALDAARCCEAAHAPNERPIDVHTLASGAEGGSQQGQRISHLRDPVGWAVAEAQAQAAPPRAPL